MTMNRRQFVRLGLAGLAGMAVSACLAASPQATPAADSTATGSTPPTPTGRGYAPPGSLMANENVSGFYVRYYETFRAPDPASWHLDIRGMVDAPTTMTLEHIAANLPFVEQNTRMKCVECWSSRAVWGGFTYAALAALVKPQAAAKHLYFACEDGYYEYLPISELEKKGALFVTHMDGRPIGAKYGAPLRMIMPWLYGYKGAKVVNTIEFRAFDEKGLWSDIGPYSTSGIVLAGRDMPLDLGGGTRPIKGGEITDY